MAVRFEEIVFHNESGIDMSVTIEAPIGEVVVTDHPVGANSSYAVRPGKADCRSALLEVNAPHHGVVRQSFATAEPAAGQLSYLQNLVARHVVGSSIRGQFTASNAGS